MRMLLITEYNKIYILAVYLISFLLVVSKFQNKMTDSHTMLYSIIHCNIRVIFFFHCDKIKTCNL